MRHPQRLAIGVLVAAVLAAVSAPATAQNCKIKRFGGPNRFSDPVDSLAQLQAMVSGHRAEIEQQLAALGWAGNPADLAAAVRDAKVTEKSFPAGTHFDWMLLRRNGQPSALKDDCWAGPGSFAGWAIDVDSKGRRWHFIVPKACGNLALAGSEALPTAPQESRISPEQAAPKAAAPAPAPPAAPKPATPPPAPAPASPPPTKAAAPAPVAKASCWTARLFGGWSFASDEDFASTAAGTPQETRTGGNVSDGWAAGVEAECRFRPRLGIPLTLLYAENDVFLAHDTRTVWEMDHGDLSWYGLTAGLNWYMTKPDGAVDFYLGPFIGLADLDVGGLDLPSLDASFDESPFLWGLQLGLDVPARDGWGFHAGVRYFDLSTDVDGSDLEFDVNPMLVVVGGSYRF